MPSVQRKGRASTTSRTGLFWALLGALLVIMGVATPGPTAARPAVEYCVPGRTAAEAGAPRNFASAAPHQARVDDASGVFAPHATAIFPSGHDSGSALTAREQIYGPTASSDPQSLPCRAYDPTGPPKTDLSQPA